MAVESERDLPENQRANWLRAMTAVQIKNHGYAIQLLQTILKNHPDFLLARKLLREQAITKAVGKKSMLRMLSSNTVGVLGIPGLIKRDPLAAFEALEKLLETEPYSSSLNHYLKEAALAANLPAIALFALETVIKGNPKDTKTMHELALLYMSNRLPDLAEDLYAKILAIASNDMAAVKGGKSAAAANSIQNAGWDNVDKGYRQLLKNAGEAQGLEQQNRVVRDDEMIDNLLRDLWTRYEKDPENVDIARRTAELYEQKNDLESAFQWYALAADLTQQTDSSLVRKVSDIRLKQLDLAVANGEKALAAAVDTEEAGRYSAELEEAKKVRAEFLLDEARKRIERNPTDPHLHFELGEILVKAGNYQAAIPPLQKARQSPNVRLSAMSLLGRCYSERRMYDLAASTLLAAMSELPTMDPVKMEVVYQLGLVYEKMGRKEESIGFMKMIYEVDANFRDVAKRVEDSYGGADDLAA